MIVHVHQHHMTSILHLVWSVTAIKISNFIYSPQIETIISQATQLPQRISFLTNFKINLTRISFYFFCVSEVTLVSGKYCLCSIFRCLFCLLYSSRKFHFKVSEICIFSNSIKYFWDPELCFDVFCKQTSKKDYLIVGLLSSSWTVPILEKHATSMLIDESHQMCYE